MISIRFKSWLIASAFLALTLSLRTGSEARACSTAPSETSPVGGCCTTNLPSTCKCCPKAISTPSTSIRSDALVDEDLAVADASWIITPSPASPSGCGCRSGQPASSGKDRQSRPEDDPPVRSCRDVINLQTARTLTVAPSDDHASPLDHERPLYMRTSRFRF